MILYSGNRHFPSYMQKWIVKKQGVNGEFRVATEIDSKNYEINQQILNGRGKKTLLKATSKGALNAIGE